MQPVYLEYRPLASLIFVNEVQHLLVELLLVSRAQEMYSSLAGHQFRTR